MAKTVYYWCCWNVSSEYTFQANLNFSLSFLRGGGSRSPLPIFGPSGLIKGIHISKNCQNNYQLCLDFSSLFLQGTDVIPRHPYLDQVHFSVKLEFHIILFAD